MVRTKADAYTKAAVKAPRKERILRPDIKAPKSGTSDKYSGGNSYCHRPVPEWQKPITSFFSKKPSTETLTPSDPEDKEKEVFVAGTAAATAAEACSEVGNSEPVPPISMEDSEPVPPISMEDSEPVPSTSMEDFEPAPGCSKDDE